MISTKIPQSIKSLFVLAGYLLLIGPPQALKIQQRANRFEDELVGHSLLFVLISETALRAGMFLLIAFFIEYLLGNELFELYRVDYVLFALIVSGGIHIFSYYLGQGLMSKMKYSSGMFIYRIGRNTAYAILPAICAAILALYSQYIGQIELFSRSLVEVVFSMTYLIFFLLGIQKAIECRKIQLSSVEIK